MQTLDSKAAANLERVLSSAQLPALPQSAIRILELSKDPKNGPAEFSLPIEADPGLTGQVLQFVNSSYFGFSREISSVKLAITLVGIRTIKNFTLWSAVFSLMPNPKCGALDLKNLWQDSLRRALCARTVARMLGVKEADEAFAGALLQDMAIPLLAKEFSTDYAALLDQRGGGKRRLSDLEREKFGWTHADAAAAMARRWDLPDELAQPIAHHIELSQWIGEAAKEPIVVAVALSALLPATVDDFWTECAQFEEYYSRLRPANGPSLAELLDQVDADFVEFAPVLQMSTPAKTLTERFAEVAATS